MKKFAKYLPIEGEIKKYDNALNPSNKKVVRVNAACLKNLVTREWKKVKLFLCSRDIQVGDKVKIEGGFKNNYIIDRKEQITELNYKVIGKISSDAVWVTEGMEFDEDEWSLFGYYSNTPYVLEGLMKNPEYQEEYKEMYHDFVVKIKCPTCKQFH